MPKDTDIVSNVSIISLSVLAAYFLLSAVIGFILGKTKTQKCTLAWLIFDAITHFVLEGSFIWISLHGTVNKAKGPLASLWQEYAIADKRWGMSDPTIVSLELVTVVLCGPLCLVLCYAIITEKFYRHFVQIVLCVCELYGGWMTFCPEWLHRSPSLRTDTFLYLWVYLFFFNFLWVIVPVLLLWQSWVEMRDLPLGAGETEIQKDVVTETFTTTSVTHRYNTRSKKQD